MKRIFHTIIIGLAMIQAGYAQTASSQSQPTANAVKSTYKVSPKTVLELRADHAFQLFHYSEAIHFYTSSGTLSTESARNLATAYYKTNQFQQCIQVYETKLQLDDLTPDEHYQYILALHSAGRTEQALQERKRFAHAYPQDLRSKSFLANQAEFNVIQTNDPHVNIRNLEFNTDEEDFGPAFCNDQVVFASTQRKFLFIKQKYLWNQRNYLNLFVAETQNDQLVKAKRFPFNQNKKWHEADACFYDQGQRMAFTQDSYKERASDKSVNLQLYFTQKENGKWAEPTPFIHNDKDFSVGHPSISENGDFLYFVSDMPGGYGGTDLYRCDKTPDGSWSKPHNLGSAINTPGNELFPFWHEASHSLYFASNGHLGLGGLDLFVSEYLGNDTYEPAFNLGAPVNSPYDDFSLILRSDSTNGYFTSNRFSGKGGEDIYAYFNSKPSRSNTQLDLLVIDRQTLRPIPDASLQLLDTKNPVDQTGHVRMELKDGTYTFTVEAVAYQPSTPKQISIKAKRRGENVVQDTIFLDVAVAEKIVVSNIFYDFDRWDILPISALELDKVVELLRNHPDLRIELGSHTDARGSEKYNLKLSQLRADAAKHYLVAQGIDSTRITATGYGKSHLLNLGPDCTPEQHRQNRRTELYIPDFVRGENPTQTAGDYLDGSPDHGKDYNSTKAHGSLF